MDPISSEASGFQQTQSTRVKDPGPAQDANPPPPPRPAAKTTDASTDAPSPHPFRGHSLNTVA